jgi:hypothetical protein
MAAPSPSRSPYARYVAGRSRLCRRVYYDLLSLLQYRRHGGNVSPSTHPRVVKKCYWRVVGVLRIFPFFENIVAAPKNK